MRRSGSLLAALCLLFVFAVYSGIIAVSVEPAYSQSAGACGLSAAAFCDTFDQPFTGGGRTGQLDPSRWTIARVGNANPSQGLVNFWVGTNAMYCKTPVSGVMPDQDYFVCGTQFGESNHFMEAFNDQGGYMYNDARIRQPFDFTNRTGIITFDVDAKTFGSHSWWPELWITDQPSPAPHLNNIQAPPRNGIGLEFSGGCPSTNTLPTPNDVGGGSGNVGLVDISRNYQVEPMLNYWTAGPKGEVFTIPWLQGSGYTCYQTMPDMKNHFEIHVSQNRVEVWASDPMMDPSMQPTMKLMATLDNLNLPFTRGYVHLQHAQYNAEKGGGTHYQTYHWDNVGFDGPKLAVPALYSIPDALVQGAAGVNIGYVLGFNGLQSGARTFQNVTVSGATGASLTFNPWIFNGASIQYRLNGGPWHTYTDSAPQAEQTWRSAIVGVSLSELRNGANTIDFAAMPGDPGPLPMVSNIDLIMEGVSGGSTGSTGVANPATSTATASPTRTSSATATLTPTGIAAASGSATATPTPTPTNTTAPTPTPNPNHPSGR